MRGAIKAIYFDGDQALLDLWPSCGGRRCDLRCGVWGRPMVGSPIT